VSHKIAQLDIPTARSTYTRDRVQAEAIRMDQVGGFDVTARILGCESLR
jgi:hypothetical protein